MDNMRLRRLDAYYRTLYPGCAFVYLDGDVYVSTLFEGSVSENDIEGRLKELSTVTRPVVKICAADGKLPDPKELDDERELDY